MRAHHVSRRQKIHTKGYIEVNREDDGTNRPKKASDIFVYFCFLLLRCLDRYNTKTLNERFPSRETLIESSK